MKRSAIFFAVVFALLHVADIFAQAPAFKPLFNGTSLDGWVRVNTDESTWQIRDKMLICSGKPIGELRTTRMYQNFVLEVEWRHMRPRGNAGIFVWADDITAPGVPFHRSIEVQVLENAYGNTNGYTTHGDIFPIHGASMEPVNGRGGSRAFPREQRSKPSPEWNHYRIECRDGDVSLAVNGKVVTEGKNCTPRKGYICIESEGGVVHYRNMRIQELPDTPVAPEQVAVRDRGYRCLYTGVDLDGWVASKDWVANDWQLQFASTDAESDQEATIETKEKFGNVGFIFDFKADRENVFLQFSIGGGSATIETNDEKWHRVEGECRRGKLTFTVTGSSSSKQSEAGQTAGPFKLKLSQPMNLANIYVREL